MIVAEMGAKTLIVWTLGIRTKDYSDYYRHDYPLNLLTWSFKYSPHPYFGYESAAIRQFERDREHRSNEDYVIGVLGGSVAEIFGYYVQAHLKDFEPLRAALPEIGNKRLVIANLALGGGHQPQQFFVASFFLKDIDLFINIEGLNEAMIFSAMPLYPLEFPSAVKSAYERKPHGRIYRWIASPLISIYQTLDWIPLRFRVLARSNVYFLLWKVSAQLLYAAIQSLQQRYYNAQIAPGNPPEAHLSPDELLERKAGMWGH